MIYSEKEYRGKLYCYVGFLYNWGMCNDLNIELDDPQSIKREFETRMDLVVKINEELLEWAGREDTPPASNVYPIHPMDEEEKSKMGKRRLYQDIREETNRVCSMFESSRLVIVKGQLDFDFGEDFEQNS